PTAAAAYRYSVDPGAHDRHHATVRVDERGQVRRTITQLADLVVRAIDNHAAARRLAAIRVGRAGEGKAASQRRKHIHRRVALRRTGFVGRDVAPDRDNVVGEADR